MRFKVLVLVAIMSTVQVSCTKEKYDISVFQTSAAGQTLEEIQPLHEAGNEVIHIVIDPTKEHQKYYGFGASFTESSAWNLAAIPKAKRTAVLTKLFDPIQGAGFSLTRTHINSSDYSNNHYTYVEDGDMSLSSFSVYEDKKGFSGDENEQVQGVTLEDPSYDLIPMIKEAQSISGANFKIIASPWSPPSWMKSGETSTMTNGSILPEYYGVWAKYLSKYVSAYKNEGINLWGLTPQNEPLHFHDARWDSNGFTPEQGRDFLRDHLGPQLVEDGHLDTKDLEAGLKVLIYDHNKSTMLNYVRPTFEDPEASKYAWGTAFHWYANSELDENNWFDKTLDTLRTTWPSKGMIHSESSIDIDSEDPIGQYWRLSTDYAGTFIPFDTYAFDIITDLNHGVQGYVEWCVILSHLGQPNPYDNFNSAPVLINPNTDEVIYTPLYYLLSHFSKYIRPDAKRIASTGDQFKDFAYTAAKNVDGSIALVVFNQKKEARNINIEIENQSYEISIAPYAMQTVVLNSH